MSIVFPKNKEKRPRSSSSEANNSFVKNVTSRMSGLLPATISKWFSSPSSSTANGSAQTDNTDSSTEDEAPESPIIMQPPAKRMRYYYSRVETTNVDARTENVESADTCSPYITGQWPRRSNIRGDTMFSPTPADCTIPGPSERTEIDSTAYKTQHTVSPLGPSVATKRKSLFNFPQNSEVSLRACTKTANNTMRDPSQPCFKPSLLGSPFYPGRTMYGGASASHINQPNIVQTKTTQVNETNNIDNTISHSAKKIMSLLENYSSPLSEARRLPPYISNRRNDSSNNSLDCSQNSNRNGSYKVQELHVPSIANILRLKKRSRLMDTTKAARQIIASHSSTVDYPSSNTNRGSDAECTYGNNTNKLTTKVKSKVVQSARVERSNVEYEMPEPLNLPSAVLQIGHDNLPNFKLGTFNTSHTLTSTTSRTTTSKTNTSEPLFTFKPPEQPTSKPLINDSINPFKFSNPVQISSASNPTAFVFSSPERCIDKLQADNKDKDDIVPCFVGAKKDKEISNWTCPDCWVSNKSDVEQCVCCTANRPSKANVKTKSNELLLNDNAAKTNIASQPIQIKPVDGSKWKCKDCWVDNKATDTKCVCCGYKCESTPESGTGSAPKNSSTAESVSESAAAEWKCDDCWIKNKASVDKCAACGGARPRTKANAALPSSAPPPSKPDNLFKNVLSTQNNKWECPNCLVRNESNKIKCACCETEKPGTAKDSGNKTFNFGINTTFKFGIDPNLNKPTQPTEPAKVETKTTVPEPNTKPSETNNNVLNETPTFTFSLPTKKAEDQTDFGKKASGEKDPPKMNFTFGIPKSVTPTTSATDTASVSTPMPALVFGIPSKPAETSAKPEDQEKPQEVPKVDLTAAKTQESSKPVPDMLKFTSTSSPSKTTTFANPLVNFSSSEKKDLPAPSFTLPATTSDDKPKSTPTFSFSGIKPASNLFGTPVTTVGTSSTSFSIPASTAAAAVPATTTSSLFTLPATNASTSLFSKSDGPSATMSLFKPDASVTTAASAAAALGTSAPPFSFGTNTQTTLNSNATQPDKPKFNFPFGSDKPKTFGSEAPKADAPKTFGSEPEKPLSFGVDANKSFSTESKPNNQWSFKNSFGGNTPLLGSSNNALGGNGLSSGGNGLPSNSGIATGGNGLGTGGLTGAANNLNAAGSTLTNNVFMSNNILGGNGLSTNPLGNSTDLTNNPLNSANSLSNNTTTPASGVFGLAAPKENIWSSNNNASNPFVPNTTANSLQKPASFTFGSSTSFNSSQPVQFGAGAGSTSMFRAGQTGASPLFSATTSNPASPVFGSPQPAATGLFGAATATAFATPKTTFDAPAQATPTPTFNFGASQQAAPVFGFGQQQQTPPQAGVYNFGGAPSVQFNMGSAPNKAPRPFRKAVRRTRPR